MADPIEVAPGVLIPATALEVRAVRSSGPGGQNVNKVASKIELLVDLAGIEGIDEGARARLDALTLRRRDAEGRLRVSAQESRDQSRNLETAREKVRRLVLQALVVPRRRRPTRPTRASNRARLDAKTKAKRTKSGRRPVAPGEE